MTTFSLVINHTNWRAERVAALEVMKLALFVPQGGPCKQWMCNEADFRGRDWQEAKVEWALSQWRWAAKERTTHHVFMTDDLHISPHFWDILMAMVEGSKARAIGLLSNHPRGPRLFGDGEHGYRTNSWIVGPAYVLEHKLLLDF